MCIVIANLSVGFGERPNGNTVGAPVYSNILKIKKNKREKYIFEY
jgi:hypothetical protein|tara:strand:- start:348 stop:482 length:135 start_codon:yes stop_codon:yes gene_type:complete